MKRTLLSLVLTLTLALGIFFALETPVSAATSGVTGSCTWQISGSTLTISGNGSMANYNETNLPPWLESAPSITAIRVGEGVTSIGDYAFMFCYAAEFVTLPQNSLVRIGDGAFAYAAASLLPLPSTLESIGEGAFLGAEIPYLEFPEGLTSIPPYCCSESSIGWVTLPETLEEIGENAFSHCQRLNGITLPQNLKTIGADAFWGCSLIYSVDLPDSVRAVGTSAFSANPRLPGFTVDENHPYFRSVGNCLVEKASGNLITGCSNSTIPEDAGIRTVGDYAFAYTEITNVQIPKGVTAIGEGAFCGCEYLHYARLDAPSVIVGPFAFANCLSVTELTLNKAAPVLQSTAFENTTVLAVWVEGAAPQELNSSHLPVLSSSAWHYADSICDKTCNECSSTREDKTAGHRYANACDSDCDRCGEERTVEGHTYYNVCDPDCNKCGEVRPIAGHEYDGACDETCNKCGYSRGEEAHSYLYECSSKCSACGKGRTSYHISTVPLARHTVENSTEYPFVLGSDGWYRSTNTAPGSTATFTLVSKHHCQNFTIVYEYGGETGKGTLQISYTGFDPDKTGEQTKTFGFWSDNRLTVTYTANGNIAPEDDLVRFKFICSCDPTVRQNSQIVPASCAGPVICDYCNATIKEALPHTYDSDCDEVCGVCEGVRTAPHAYESDCDTDCNACGEVRQNPAEHRYDNPCDLDCNACGATRQVSHQYDDACDSECNLCHTPRKAPHVFDSSDDLICNACSYERPPYILGDVDGNGEVDLSDAIYLLYHVNFKDTYPVNEGFLLRWPLAKEDTGPVTGSTTPNNQYVDIDVGGWANNGKISARAAEDGVVIRSGYFSDWGNLVVVDHGNGYQTYYAHLASASVSVGQNVSAGDEVGKVGATGNTSTVKLRFLLYAPVGNGGASVRVDPLSYIKQPK